MYASSVGKSLQDNAALFKKTDESLSFYLDIAEHILIMPLYLKRKWKILILICPEIGIFKEGLTDIEF